MDDTTRSSILMAAINTVPVPSEPTTNSKGVVLATPQETWLFDVEQKAMEIAILTGSDSRLSQRLELIDRAFDKTFEPSKGFVATITGFDLEASSKRVQLTFSSLRDGEVQTENARTDRTDTPSGALMARHARSLVGHRVVVYLEMEPINSGPQKGNKARVVRYLHDLGRDTTFEG